jgi:hypothetical protein
MCCCPSEAVMSVFARTLFKAIYIQRDVRPIAHFALAKKIKTSKGGKKKFEFLFGREKKYSLASLGVAWV